MVFDNLSGKLLMVVHVDASHADAWARGQARLDELMQQLREAMNEYLQAMQQQMLEEMRKNPQANKQQQQNQQGGQQGDALGRNNPDGTRDPLGRDVGENGRVGTDEQLLQGEDVYRRAQELLDEIRRRSGEQERPDEELDYLKRLLERRTAGRPGRMTWHSSYTPRAPRRGRRSCR